MNKTVFIWTWIVFVYCIFCAGPVCAQPSVTKEKALAIARNAVYITYVRQDAPSVDKESLAPTSVALRRTGGRPMWAIDISYPQRSSPLGYQCYSVVIDATTGVVVHSYPRCYNMSYDLMGHRVTRTPDTGDGR